MLFSRDLLFIHVPKTGGMSVTKYLLENLPRPVYYVHSFDRDPEREEGVVHVRGNRHASLDEARRIVEDHGFDIREFPVILAVLRDPYRIEVSRYAYLQIGHPWDAGPEQELATNEDFGTFVRQSSYSGGFGTSIEGYFQLDGEFPENLRIARLEELSRGVRGAMEEIGLPSAADLPWVNRSRHDDFASYYSTAEAERAVYSRYRWVFDSGFYPRREVQDDLEADSSAGAAIGHKLPVEGPVRQVGASSGFWQDRWMGPDVRLSVKARREIARLTVSGWLPDRFGGPCELTVEVGHRSHARAFGGGQSFSWDVPCEIGAGTVVEIGIACSDTWCPARKGVSGDRREICFKLKALAFRDLTEVIGEAVGFIPHEATVMVVTRGDETLLEMNGRRMWHFPRTEAGVYAGHHPGDSREAIGHLEQLRARGGGFILFPKPAFWWLEHYDGFRRHLDDNYQRVWRDEYSIVYDLAD